MTCDNADSSVVRLKLDTADRVALWTALGTAIEEYVGDADELPASVSISAVEVEQALDAFDFDTPMSPHTALSQVMHALRVLQPHVRHARHFGLFDAAPTTMGVVGDTLAAVFNPCLSSWRGSPFGVGTERRLVTIFGRRFGYAERHSDGLLTTGGSEANFTALLLALTARFPTHHARGMRGIDAQPVVYLTDQVHPSARRAVAMAGLGTDAVRVVPVDESLRMDPRGLEELIRSDRAAGLVPLLVTATAGTTGAGTIDPIAEVADVARRHGVWLHVDAAWGGAAALLPKPNSAFDGLPRADSITFDAHKWMSVPIGAGMLLTRHRGLLTETFRVSPGFLSAEDIHSIDPLGRSMRWSRDFAGLKILLSLAVAGWCGYEQTWREQIRLGDELRNRLRSDGWRPVNDTPLPVVCFVDELSQAGTDETHLDLIAHEVNSSGRATTFRVRIGGQPALRACITNYATTSDDITTLVGLLDEARTRVGSGAMDGSMFHTGEPVGTCQARWSM